MADAVEFLQMHVSEAVIGMQILQDLANDSFISVIRELVCLRPRALVPGKVLLVEQGEQRAITDSLIPGRALFDDVEEWKKAERNFRAGGVGLGERGHPLPSRLFEQRANSDLS